jgi:hypothetical protein
MDLGKIAEWFTKGKVIFVTIAGVITFSITMYNQFKSNKTTEISGVVTATKDGTVPVDAIVKISSPIQSQTETDAKGRFKFKFENLQSDTFLIIVQNKRTNLVTKQNEYVSAGQGRKDIVVLLGSDYNTGRVYPRDTTTNGSYRKKPDLSKILRQLHIGKR